MDAVAIIPIFIGLVFVLVIGAILFSIVRGVGQWAWNNGQPVLTEQARVVAKRTETGGHVGGETGGRVYTTYYVTFELESGERREFEVRGRDSGALVEGDEGSLTYQGTRYKGFERARAASGITGRRSPA